MFISFDDLFTRIKDIVCTVVDNTLAKHGDKTRKMDPSFEAPTRPFLRMTNTDTIKSTTSAGSSIRGSRSSLARTSRRSRSAR